jgi:hypothetical protein
MNANLGNDSFANNFSVISIHYRESLSDILPGVGYPVELD